MVGRSDLSTGLRSLDEVLNGILAGDNIVWQVDCIADYEAFVHPYCKQARADHRKIIYFRFANHKPLLTPDEVTAVHDLHPERGFESLIATVHGVIRDAGRGAFYVFDCLSDLAADWYSDQMLGNFFMLTCPYLYDLETITYFAIFRDRHSSRATEPISSTTQLFLDVYHHGENRYVRPLKVLHRHSPTMNLVHAWRDGNKFEPVTASALISEILTASQWSGLTSDSRPSGRERAFVGAQQHPNRHVIGTELSEADQETFFRLARMVFSRDENMLRLMARYLTIEDILNLHRRMIGTGLIGGKAVGMLLARAILGRSGKFDNLLEPNDSFYIGSDVFYTFMVHNGVWWARQRQMNPNTFLEVAEGARSRILTGRFPEYILQQFRDMLDYFGQSPLIVRSSSLLEDNYGNAFAGKYESVFCTNQGHRERRMEDLLAAVRTVYASTMSENALRYRARRGLLGHDEQMALLVMRVSGEMHGRHFYLAAAGVGYSFNPYAWSEHIDPEAGVLRLVFGLGTRAVDRSDDDYTRIVALNAPDRRPESNMEEVRQYAQRRVDALDLDSNQLTSSYFVDLVETSKDLPIEMFATLDRTVQSRTGTKPWVLTLDGMIKNTDFVEIMRKLLTCLEKAYAYPVDIEFTVNFVGDKQFKVNVVQCRPLQVRGGECMALEEVEAPEEDRILEAHGAIIGQSRRCSIDRLIYVVPEVYSQLPVQERYEVARVLGRLNRAEEPGPENVLLMGPGRWGTSSPSLGIPVAFHDISKVTVLCEIVAMHDNLVPDASLGTHFLSELVEMDMLYLAIFPGQSGNTLETGLLIDTENQLVQLLPDAERWEKCIKVVDVSTLGTPIMLQADAHAQKVVCYFDRT